MFLKSTKGLEEWPKERIGWASRAISLYSLQLISEGCESISCFNTAQSDIRKHENWPSAQVWPCFSGAEGSSRQNLYFHTSQSPNHSSGLLSCSFLVHKILPWHKGGSTREVTHSSPLQQLGLKCQAEEEEELGSQLGQNPAQEHPAQTQLTPLQLLGLDTSSTLNTKAGEAQNVSDSWRGLAAAPLGASLLFAIIQCPQSCCWAPLQDTDTHTLCVMVWSLACRNTARTKTNTAKPQSREQLCRANNRKLFWFFFLNHLWEIIRFSNFSFQVHHWNQKKELKRN